jgi:Tol biopolymer transport system component
MERLSNGDFTNAATIFCFHITQRNSPENEKDNSPSSSPDGKKLAFIEDRRTLKVKDIKIRRGNHAIDARRVVST